MPGAASQLEVALSPVITRKMEARERTSYRWRAADEVARPIINVPTRFYRVTEAGRTHNLPREMKFPGGVVLVVIDPTDFTVADVINRIVAYAPRRSDMPNTIVMMTEENGTWRGEAVLQRAGTIPTFDVDRHFPLVGTPVPFVSL